MIRRVDSLRDIRLRMAEHNSLARYHQRISRERILGLAHVRATARRIRIELGLEKTHLLRIVHDAESHEYDCHDGCEADVICPGVVDSCRTWWECDTCRIARRAMTLDQLEDHDEQLYAAGEAHGVDHQRIDGVWMTPGTTCLAYSLESNAGDFVDELPDGDHMVDLDYDDGYVHLHLINTATEGAPQ